MFFLERFFDNRYFIIIIHSTVSAYRVIALVESHFIQVLFIDNGHILAIYCQINITTNEQMCLSEHLQSLKVISADKLKQPGICSLLCAFLFFQGCV